jgi:hypothetical protein
MVAVEFTAPQNCPPFVLNVHFLEPGDCPKANEGTKAMQRRTRLIGRMSFIMPLKAESYQSGGKMARGVSNPVLAAEAQKITSELSPLGVGLLFSSI